MAYPQLSQAVASAAWPRPWGRRRGRARAVYIDSLRLRDAVKGEPVAEIPLDDKFRKRFRNPYAVLHHAALHGLLLDA